jgi:hypothetical protein
VVYDMENLETWMQMLKIFDLFSKWQTHILKFFKTIMGGLWCNKFEKLNVKVQNIWFVWQMANENLGWFFKKPLRFEMFTMCHIWKVECRMLIKWNSWFWVLLFYKLKSMNVHTMMTFAYA